MAADGAETRVMGSFDLVLLDLSQPDVDGMELLRELRGLDPDCAIVLITGAGGVNSATAAVLEDADGYIEKQHLTTAGENAQFFYALAQAIEHRTGDVAGCFYSDGKPARLTVGGADIEADRPVLDALKDSLLHLIRNAIGPWRRRCGHARSAREARCRDDQHRGSVPRGPAHGQGF